MKIPILFFTISDRPKLSDLTYPQLRKYCGLHGYDLHICTRSLDRSRHIAWSKIILAKQLMLQHQNKYIFYVWIDDDILITKIQQKFERLLRNYPFQDILLSEDVGGFVLNSGIMVLRNTETTLKVLDQAYQIGEELNLQWDPLWEQSALQAYYTLISPEPFVLIPQGVIQSFHRNRSLGETVQWEPGHFAAHVSGMEMEDRLVMLRELNASLSF